MSLYAEAVKFATVAHAGQFRKGTGEPYVAHPIAVAALLIVQGAPEPVQVAAVLHDTVEDTDVTLEQIEELFGKDVALLVDAVTKRPGEQYFQFLDRTIQAGLLAIMLKLADVKHNAATLGNLPAEKQASLGARYEKAERILSAALAEKLGLRFG